MTITYTKTARKLPTVTHTTNKNGTARYQVNGKDHTKASRRHYTHASVYVRLQVGPGQAKNGAKVGDLVVWLHSREDLAIKGSADANRAPAWFRKVGHVAIVDLDTTPAPAAEAVPAARTPRKMQGQPVTDAYRDRVIADATPLLATPAAPAEKMALRAVRVPDALWDAAKAAAADNGDNVSAIIRAALETYVDVSAVGVRV